MALPEPVAPLFVTLALTVSMPLVLAFTAGGKVKVGVTGENGDGADSMEEIEELRVG